MSVLYNYDPGRLELYRPRADGLMSRCFGGSLIVHLVVGCLLLTIRLPQPAPPKRRPYKITEVTLLPRAKPVAPPKAEAPEPKPVAELGPRDLSLFLDDMAPVEPQSRRRRSRRSRRARQRALRTASLPPSPAREVKPEAPDTNMGERQRLGQQIASNLPHFLERPMADRQPPDPVRPPADQPSRQKPSPRPAEAPVAKPAPQPKRVEVAAPEPAKPAAARPQPVVESPRRRPAGGDRQEQPAAPQPIRMARAERPRSLPDLVPNTREDGGSTGPSAIPSVPVSKPPAAPEERPAALPSGRAGSGKRIAELPGNLFGEGSGAGPGPSRREPSLPEGRPGAASTPGPRRPRVSRGASGTSEKLATGDATGISPVPAPGGIRLSDDERPGTVTRGEPTGLGEPSGKGTREASLPSTGDEVSGRGSGAASSGEGAGGGYGSDGPRATGGGSRPGRPARPSGSKVATGGDGSGGSLPSDTGIGLGGLGPGAGGSQTLPSAGGGRGTGGGLGNGDGPGKRVARADLPTGDSNGGSRGPGSGPGSGSGKGPGEESGPRSFDRGGRKSVSRGGEGSGDGPGGKRGGDGEGDSGGVAIGGGGAAGDDGPGKGAGDGDTGFKKGRREPKGVYVDTTGRYTLPGAIYQGDYNYNSRALRKIMDELNSRTKVKVRLGGEYESIAPGSFRRAPVVVFTGHKAFELTEEQRKLLKEYVEKGGMIWADLSHSAFDRSFKEEMEKLFGRAPVALSSGHPIYRSFYLLHGPPPGDFGQDAPFQGISLDGRLAVVITPNRYFSAVTKTLNTREEDQEGAIQAVVNVYMYAVGSYRAAQDAGD